VSLPQLPMLGRNLSLTVSRVQLAINVTDVEAAVAFYSKLFQTEPAKRRPGYANFAIAEPPLKLVLIESPDAGATLNHLGVEVSSTAEVSAATRRLADAGLATAVEDGVECCYALQDKVWVSDPDGAPWEVYTVLGDTDVSHSSTLRVDSSCGAGACAPDSEAAAGAAVSQPQRAPRPSGGGQQSRDEVLHGQQH
jgi:catechol 2,3-dioxygenase-like lactoylglutathione lyase family enzyme